MGRNEGGGTLTTVELVKWLNQDASFTQVGRLCLFREPLDKTNMILN